MTPFNRLKLLVFTQGIVSHVQPLSPETDLVQDLLYSASDMAELIRMTEREFGLSIPVEDWYHWTRLDEIMGYIDYHRITP